MVIVTYGKHYVNVFTIYHVKMSPFTAELGMFVLNKEYYGNLVMPKAYQSLQEAREEFLNFKLATLGKKPVSAVKINLSPTIS